jgi:chromosome segregation ATPase
VTTRDVAEDEGFLGYRRHSMVCSLFKKGLIGAALGAGTLFLVFGTHAPSYVRTAVHRVKQNAKDAVPLPFDIDRAREEIAGLEPAIRENIVKLARAEVEVAHLEKEIASDQTNMDVQKTAMLTLRNSLKTGEYRLAGHSRVAYTEDEVKADLARRYDSLKSAQNLIEAKKATLKAKNSEMLAFRKQLDTMMAQKKALSTKLDQIEAKLHQIEATEAANEFEHLDDTALSRAKETVSDLEKRLEVMEKKAEMEARYVETGVPVIIDPARDVVKEIDAEFGQCTPSTGAKAGKSL